MESVGAHEAKARHGHPVARLVSVEEDDRACAHEAARRIRARRNRLEDRMPLAELMETVHEGHRY